MMGFGLLFMLAVIALPVLLVGGLLAVLASKVNKGK